MHSAADVHRCPRNIGGQPGGYAHISNHHAKALSLEMCWQDWKRFRTFLALQAYAPYTRCAAGVALLTFRSRIHHGAYLESAAFNPGLPPLQAALVAAIRAGMDDYEEVVAHAAYGMTCISLLDVLPRCQLATERSDGSVMCPCRLWMLCSSNCQMRRCSSGSRRRFC